MPNADNKKMSDSSLRTTHAIGVAFLLGATLSLAMFFLPILPGDRRFIGLAIFFGITGLIGVIGTRFERRRVDK